MMVKTVDCLIRFAEMASDPAYYAAEFQTTDRGAVKPYRAQFRSPFRPTAVSSSEEVNPISRKGVGAQDRLVIIQFESIKNASTGTNLQHIRRLSQSAIEQVTRESILLKDYRLLKSYRNKLRLNRSALIYQ